MDADTANDTAPPGRIFRGHVVGVCADAAHRFSKPTQPSIRLIAGQGVDGDAHAGAFVKHRYLARSQPQTPNIRQVHLIPSELFAGLPDVGLAPGDLGENVTTAGMDLHILPLGTLLQLGGSAEVELTGLRTPCGYIDKFYPGLKRRLIVKRDGKPTFTAGVMGVVRASGDLAPGDHIRVVLPQRPWRLLPAI